MRTPAIIPRPEPLSAPSSRPRPVRALRPRAALLLTCALAALLATAACGAPDPAVVATPTTTSTTPPDPTRPPAELRWEAWQGVQLPFAQEGPTKIAESALGYSHSPQGAVLAAIHHTLRVSLSPDGSWPRMAAQSLMPGPGKDSWVIARALLSITTPADPATAPTITAYKVNTYADARAEIVIYSTYPDASITANTATVVWLSDDWRLLIPDPAAKVQTVQAVSFIPFDVVRLEHPQ
ncbi:hypothetical protein JK358_36260 [Nocardia sp. 2]|uniref:DUF8175 domain-containing protein n=1 Tax=Nocardia acididurans TaxID=2802282 RepID=A0ABS1MHW5_9NOCA|nr:hypothetical protein [Nocardia acididurans]MBL1079866.1 hypothetical protein [Nocardia acididurans]